MEIGTAIPIENVYHMLAYAYQILTFSEYKNFHSEKVKNVKDLYSEILLIGLPTLIRGGLLKDYIKFDENSLIIRGKIDINSSIKKNALIDKKLVVVYEEFSEDILLNQILKATLCYLSKVEEFSREKRRKFSSYLFYFSKVSDVELNLNLWREVQYNRQNIRYQFLIDICRFLHEELLLLEGTGISYPHFMEEKRLPSLFEKFVYAFYKKETKYNVKRPQILWKVENGFYDALPVMQTDVVLQNRNKTLIIDTKFYSNNMSKRFKEGKSKQKSSNLYQIFAYINNWVTKEDEIVSGMLLYAKTTEEKQPNHCYQINGNLISIRNIDLNQNFEKIHNDLIKLVEEILGEKKENLHENA